MLIKVGVSVSYGHDYTMSALVRLYRVKLGEVTGAHMCISVCVCVFVHIFSLAFAL